MEVGDLYVDRDLLRQKMKVETEGSSEMTVSVYKSTGCHISQDHAINTYGCTLHSCYRAT